MATIHVPTACVVAALLTVSVGAQSARPTILPHFQIHAAGGPAFVVECVNDTGRAVSSADKRWPLFDSGIQIDGKPLPQNGWAGSFGGGVQNGWAGSFGGGVQIAPGATWRAVMMFPQSATGAVESGWVGAHATVNSSVALSHGRHTIAVRCGEQWSDEVAFFWNGEGQQGPGARKDERR